MTCNPVPVFTFTSEILIRHPKANIFSFSYFSLSLSHSPSLSLSLCSYVVQMWWLGLCCGSAKFKFNSHHMNDWETGSLLALQVHWQSKNAYCLQQTQRKEQHLASSNTDGSVAHIKFSGSVLCNSSDSRWFNQAETHEQCHTEIRHRTVLLPPLYGEVAISRRRWLKKHE